MLLEEDAQGWDHLVAAVHWLPPPYGSSNQAEAEQGFMATTERLLAEHHVAAEINYHSNDPDPAFIACCLEQGVKISMGSDSHRLYEVADFHPHLRLLRQVTGDSSNLEEILFRI